MERALLVAFTAALGALFCGEASAQVGLRVAQVADGAVRVDGSLREWRGERFVDVGSGSDAALSYALRYDSTGIYVGATVNDERLVRTARPSTNEDAVVLTVAVPAGRGRYRAVDVWLYAGVPGRQAGSAAVGPLGGRARAASAIRVVEGPTRGGYVIEAHVPFGAIGGSRWEDGRGAIRLRDVDTEARPEVEAELASATIDPRHPERLPSFEPTGGDRATLRDFLRRQGLEGTQPRHDLRGDVAGDRAPERVIVVDRYVLVLGRGASSFLYLDLPVVSAAGIRDADLVDLTGDGKREIAITMRQSNDRGSRDLWQVYTVGEDAIRPLFGIELRKQTSEGFVESRLRVRRARRGAALIEVTAGRSNGLDADNLRESPPADVEAMLLPWGPKLSKTWQWDGQRFVVVRERDNPDYRDPTARAATERASRGPSRTSGGGASQEQRGPSVDDLIAAFKRQAGLSPRARPRFRTVANVAEGREDEHVMVFDEALVVVGTGFRGGTGWFHFALPVAAAEDVLSVETADLTGDGRQELLFRVRRSVEDVQREILIVHQFRPTGFPRLLAVEVAREQGGARIENQVSVQRARRASVLAIAPGRARGWDAQSWPFQDGTGDGVEPILLPWRDRAVRYEYRGGELSR